MELVVVDDADALAQAAARIFRARLRGRPALAMAVPAGRTPRRMYGVMQALQTAEPVDFSAMRVFSVDELCPPAPADGYFWRQVRADFLGWANVTRAGCRPFRVDAADLDAMCKDYDAAIERGGGLDVVMLGLGPNGHLASNEPGTAFSERTRVVRLLPGTVDYILSDDVIQGPVGDRAVTLGLATIMEAREVILLVSGAHKRPALRAVVDGPVTPAVPASILRRHPRCTIVADRAAAS